MPTEVQVGDAVLWGMRNDGDAIEIEGYATFLLDSAKLNHEFESEYVKDETGHDAAGVGTNGMVKLDVTFVPSGATRAAAQAVAAMPTMLQSVELSNFAVAAFNGSYLYEGGASIDLSHGVGKMTLKLRRYDDEDQNEAMTAPVEV